MKTPLAWCNLVQERPRTLVATAGVAFSLTLVFLQLGFLASVVTTATLILDRLDYDIALTSPQYRQLGDAGTFPKARLYEAAAGPGVVRVVPFDIGVQKWRIVQRGKRRAILMLGFDPDDRPFRRLPLAEGLLAVLREDGTMLLDTRSHEDFGPSEPGGEHAELGGRRLRIGGRFTMGTGFASDGLMLVGDRTFHSLLPMRPPGRVSLGLLQITPGADPAAVARRIEGFLKLMKAEASERPDMFADRVRQAQGRVDVRVWTRRELREKDIHYWLREKSIGIIFMFGVGVALLVGLIVVYQVLSSDIVDHFKEYATLKAMGYTNRYLTVVVVQQALILSLLGYVPALLGSLALYKFTRDKTKLPIEMTLDRGLLVLGLSAATCVVAALLSVRKVTSSDPASLF